jgi:hypothetical protein
LYNVLNGPPGYPGFERLERFERASVLFWRATSVSLEATFCDQKAGSKPLKDAFYASLFSEIKQLPGSDPAYVRRSFHIVNGDAFLKTTAKYHQAP